MRLGTLAIAGGIAWVAATSPGQAAIDIDFPFVGSVNECFEGEDACNGPSKPFSGSFGIDLETDDTDFKPENFGTSLSDVGIYGTPSAPAGDITLSFDGTSYSGNANYDVYDNSVRLFDDLLIDDGFIIFGALNDEDGNALDFTGLLVGSDLSLFDSDALPTEVGDLANASLIYAGATIETLEKVEGQFVTDRTFDGPLHVVPLPAGIVLFVSGLAGVGAMVGWRRA